MILILVPVLHCLKCISRGKSVQINEEKHLAKPGFQTDVKFNYHACVIVFLLSLAEADIPSEFLRLTHLGFEFSFLFLSPIVTCCYLGVLCVCDAFLCTLVD